MAAEDVGDVVPAGCPVLGLLCRSGWSMARRRRYVGRAAHLAAARAGRVNGRVGSKVIGRPRSRVHCRRPVHALAGSGVTVFRPDDCSSGRWVRIELHRILIESELRRSVGRRRMGSIGGVSTKQRRGVEVGK